MRKVTNFGITKNWFLEKLVYLPGTIDLLTLSLTKADNNFRESWLIKLMKIVLLVEHALMNVPLKQSKKATFMLLILKFALIVELVPMFVRLKLYTRNKVIICNFQKKEAIRVNSLLFLYTWYG